MKEFNVTGTCIPGEHYMVDTSEKLDQIIQLIEKKKYFTINRARQYGKTTTLDALNRNLESRYHIIWMSFEGMAEETFADNKTFVEIFIAMVADNLEFTSVHSEVIHEWQRMDRWETAGRKAPFEYLSKKITRLCKGTEKEILLMIDEVDKVSDNQIFLNFLGMLRNKYLSRSSGRDHTFKSVILASVYDIKNLKLKICPDEERKYNSPWNIAADFVVDMSFSPEEIATMLEEYEEDYHTGMDIVCISKELYFYTNGYPFLVSLLCKWIDENGGKIWTSENLRNAQKAILKTRNTLFDDLIKNVENDEELKRLIINLLYYGKSFSYSLAAPIIQKGVMLGIFTEKKHMLAISNLTYEMYLYDYTINSKSMEDSSLLPEQSQFIKNGKLDMPRVLQKFQELMKSEYRKENNKFLEQQGRLLFLCFLKPIINGTGFYYVEPETRNNTRMDLVIAYGGEEHICELKIWHGTQYRKEGITQLENYMESRNTKKGYLVSFSFIKEKQYLCNWLSPMETDKKIFEVII